MAQEIFRKLNVLELYASLGYGGGQRNMMGFVKYLNKDIFNVFVVGYIFGGSQEEKLKKMNIEYLIAQGSVEKIKNFIKEKSIDIMHIHRSGGVVALETEIIKVARNINPQIVIIEKNVFGKYDPLCNSDLDCSLFQSMMHINERYLPESKAVFNFERMKVFYNMIDQEEFETYRLTLDQINEYKALLGIAKEDFILGKIGRPDISKWSDLILDMIPYLVKKLNTFKFIIQGIPESRKKRIQKSKFKKHFIILPETADDKKVHGFYQIIDLLVHSSKIGECNGNTINEAMFWKKPVITNSTPHKDNGQLEQVLHMRNGIIANHPQTMAQAIEFLYKNKQKRQAMGETAHNFVLIHNEPVSLTHRLEKLFFEKIQLHGLSTHRSQVEFYKQVDYNPTEKEIIDYKEEYQKRLNFDFGTLTAFQKISNILRLPKKFYFKILDFIKHKYGS